MSPPSQSLSNSLPAPPVQRLSRLQFWLCLLVALAFFLFSVGPIWAHPWNINLLDSAIYISYLIIPIMVIACLAYRKSLNWRGAFLDMMEMTLLKYALTFSFALILWATSHRPLQAQNFLKADSRWSSPEAIAGSADIPAELPPPSVIPKEITSSVSGRVFFGDDHKPAKNALVFISKGLEHFSFAPPSNALMLENNGQGIVPQVSAAMLGQKILAHSNDGHLHTFIAKDIRDDNDSAQTSTARLNVPLIRSGSWTPIRFEGAGFIAEIRCSVHPSKDAEAPAYVGVFAHPFFQLTDGEGRFQLDALPEGELSLSVFHPALGLKNKVFKLSAGQPLKLDLDLR